MMLLLALSVLAAPAEGGSLLVPGTTQDSVTTQAPADVAPPAPPEAATPPGRHAAPSAQVPGAAVDEELGEPAPARRHPRSLARRKNRPDPAAHPPEVDLADRALAAVGVGGVTLGLQLAFLAPAAAILTAAVLLLSAGSVLSLAMVWGTIAGTMAFFVALGTAHALVVVMAALGAAGLTLAGSAVAAKAGSIIGPRGTYRVQVLRALVPQAAGAAVAVVALGVTGVLLAVLSAPALFVMMVGRSWNRDGQDPSTINLGGYLVVLGCLGAMAPWFVLAPLGVVAAAAAAGVGVTTSAVVAGVGAGADVELPQAPEALTE